jgi:hypothetical protein
MTSKVTVKGNKIVYTARINHPRNTRPEKSRPSCVAIDVRSIYTLLET